MDKKLSTENILRYLKNELLPLRQLRAIMSHLKNKCFPGNDQLVFAVNHHEYLLDEIERSQTQEHLKDLMMKSKPLMLENKFIKSINQAVINQAYYKFYCLNPGEERYYYHKAKNEFKAL